MGANEPSASATDDRSDPFEWRPLEGDSETTDNSRPDRSRRGIVRPAVSTIMVALLALLLVGMAPQGAVAHTTFTAGDVNLTTNSGRVTSLTVAPGGDVHYDGLEAVPSSVDVEVSARLSGDSTWEAVTSQSVSASGLEGTANYSFAEVSLLTTTSMTTSDFAAADGATETTDVELRVRVTLVGAGPGGGDVNASSMDTFSVTVTNQAAGAGVGGKGNPAGGGA